MSELPELSELPEVRFTSLVYGGWALGRLPDGRALFAPYLLPGERALIRVTESRTGYARGQAAEILEASPRRVTPRCRHFGECGGCHYQHLAYEAQLEAKQAVLREQLARLAGLHDPPLLDPLPSPSPWYYRNHLQFHRAADGRPGFRAFRSSRVVPISECHLPEPELAERWPLLPAAARGRLILRRGTGGPPAVWEEKKGGPGAAVSPAAPVQFDLPCGGFRVSPGSFFQVNTPMAARLAEEVLFRVQAGLADGGRQAAVLDLYCGVGLFSAFLAERVGRLVAVEASPEAVEDFVYNLDEFDNVEIYEAPASNVLPSLDLQPDFVLLDPPRTGLEPAVLNRLLEMRPPLVVYVSCDPATLARDARRFSLAGYCLADLALFDQFPQTGQIESITLMTRE